MTFTALEVAALLPLPPATFHILIALAEGDRHGYAIIQDTSLRSEGAIRLSAGTLYRSVQRMLEQGLIEETPTRPAPDEDDERRRYYRLTAFGGAVARGEARRLQDLVTLARASGFAPESFSSGNFVRRYPERRNTVTDLLIGDLFTSRVDAVWGPMESLYEPGRQTIPTWQQGLPQDRVPDKANELVLPDGRKA